MKNNLRKISLKPVLMSFLILFCSCSATSVLINNSTYAYSDESDKNSLLEYDVKKHLKSNNVSKENTIPYLFDELNCKVIRREDGTIIFKDKPCPTSADCYENLTFLDNGKGYYLGYNACDLKEGNLCVIYENDEGNIDKVPTNAYSKDLVNKIPQSFKFIKNL